jgi:signal transduction histidine kinase
LVGVHLYDAGTNALVPVAWSDALASVLNGPPPSIPSGAGLVWRVYETAEPQFYADVRDAEGILDASTTFRSELHLPLGEHGVIIVGSTSVDDFDVTDKTLAKVWAANVEAALDRIERERERKCYQERLQETTEELEALNRIVRHDIRNDMGIILGWAEYLEAHVDEAGQEHLRKILTSGEHVVELTEVAREYIEVLTSEDGLTVTPTPLRTTFETELNLRRESFPEAEFVLGDEVPRIAVQANEMLGAVFRNLLSNAVQHNDKDDPRVRISFEEDEKAVRIRIADNGPGIPKAQTDSIFEKGDKSLTSSGSGIGLYLVRTLLEQYDGSIAVEENDPEGTVFVVRLRKAE